MSRRRAALSLALMLGLLFAYQACLRLLARKDLIEALLVRVELGSAALALAALGLRLALLTWVPAWLGYVVARLVLDGRRAWRDRG